MNHAWLKTDYLKRGFILLFIFSGFILQVVGQTPSADFSANVQSGCAPLSVRFTDESTGNPTHWSWELDDGSQQQLSNQQNPTLSLTRPGVYTVTLVVRNANGVHAVTRTDYITVFPSPSVSFTADITTACLPARVQFTGIADTESGTIDSWAWDFGDGQTATSQNPVHTYSQAGWYNVSLAVTSSTGCAARRVVSRYIRVVSGITSGFSYTPPSSCGAPFGVAFSNESSGPGALTYHWDFGDGNSDTARHPIHAFDTDGSHNVTLTTTSSFGCSSQTTLPVTIQAFTTDFIHPDTVCINQLVNFQNRSGAGVVGFNWRFGDGSSSATDANPVKRYTVPGVYEVMLVNRFGHCTDSASRTIVVTGAPQADFTAVNNFGCGPGYPVDFQSQAPTAISWEWDFGDGNTASTENPSHTYTGAGNYTVSLTITTAGGCRHTVTKNNIVRITAPSLEISSSRTSGCAPLGNVVFTATGNVIPAISSYHWDFGDGSSSTDATPSHNYTGTGAFNVRLTAVTTGGCTLSRDLRIVAGAPPTNVDFTTTASGLCASDPVRFEATASGPVTEWEWVFSDGDTVLTTLAEYEHRFSVFGAAGATLTAIHNGCRSQPEFKDAIVALEAPVANFGIALDCDNRLSVSLSDSSMTDAATSYRWDFGDGIVSDMAIPQPHVYAATGQYTVLLELVSGACTSSVARSIDLTPLDSTFNLSRNVVCKHEPVTFTANAESMYVQEYRWSWGGNPAFSGEKLLDTAFHADGDIPVTLFVTDPSGCTVESTQYLKVTGPTAAFTPALLAECTNTAVSFIDASVSDVGIASWSWDFGDGATQVLNGGPFEHQYADTGRYVVRLSVTDIAGCTDENVASNTIRISGPVASFSTEQTTTCPGTPLTFTNTSQGTGLTWSWDFGDGSQSTASEPDHAFDEGVFTVKLLVTDDVGCRDSLIRTEYVQALRPVAAFEVEDSTSICPLLEVKFAHNARNYASLEWDFGDSFYSTQDAGVVRHFYDDYGSYPVRLLAHGHGGGCADTARFTVNVYNPNAFTQFDYSVDPFYCNEHTVNFRFEAPPNTSYQFNFGDGNTDSSGETSLQHTYDFPRTYRPSLSLQDAVGCQSTVSAPHLIDIRGAVPAFNLDRRSFCDAGTVSATNFTVSSEPVTAWAWNFGTGADITVRDPYSFTYDAPGLYPVSLTATTRSGCTQTYTDTVRVPRTPQPVITLEDMTCVNRTVQFNGNLVHPDTAIQWNWSFGDGRTSATQYNAISYPASGAYAIALSASNFLGCTGHATQSFTVAPLPVITTQSAQIIVSNEVVLPVTYSPGVVSYTWTPPGGLSCTDCPQPVARPQFTETYTVQATDQNTCTATAELTVTVMCTEENYFVPNTFSPNGDGMNDVFYPRGRGLARVQSMRIFNRWGQAVYERKNFMANDPSSGWNGRMNGQPLPSDTYVYVIEFVCDNAMIVPFKGNITLIR